MSLPPVQAVHAWLRELEVHLSEIEQMRSFNRKIELIFSKTKAYIKHCQMLGLVLHISLTLRIFLF